MSTHAIELLAWARSANGRNDPSNPPMVAAYAVRQSFAADVWAEEERLTSEAFAWQ